MEDFGAILIRFKNGSIGIVEGSACVYPKNLEETLSIFGENGTVVIGGLAVNKIQTWQFADERDYDKEDGSTEVDSVYGKGHTPLYKDFVGAIRDNMEPYINGEGGKKALEIIIRAYDNA
jgi:predicted dehydrogenase